MSVFDDQIVYQTIQLWFQWHIGKAHFLREAVVTCLVQQGTHFAGTDTLKQSYMLTCFGKTLSNEQIFFQAKITVVINTKINLWPCGVQTALQDKYICENNLFLLMVVSACVLSASTK